MKAQIIDAVIIDGKTIQLKEPVNINNKNVKIIIQPIDEHKINKEKLLEKYKQKIWMSPDFNQPIDDFKEYMEWNIY